MKTLESLVKSIKTRIAMEMIAPVVLDLSEEAIALMTVDVIPEIMLRLNFEDIEALIIPLHPLTMSGESVDLPEDLFAVKTVVLSSGKKCTYYNDFSSYKAFDETSALMTPTDEAPIASVAGGKLFVRPNQTEVRLDYYQIHPPLDGSQGTLLSAKGDKLVEDLIVARYFAQAMDYSRAKFEGQSEIGAEK